MHTITVRRSVAAPPEVMFDLLADPTTYLRFPGVRVGELLRAGEAEPHGVGALRRIQIGSFRFDEEIVGAERGVFLEYRVIASRPRLEHERGRIELTPAPTGCAVRWTSTYRVPVPVVGRVIEHLGGRRMARAFDDAIRVSGEIATDRTRAPDVGGG